MEESNMYKALVDLSLDSAKENRDHAKRWFMFSVISNIVWALLFAFVTVYGIKSFFAYENQFEYVVTETAETNVNQDTEGAGNNIYQAGEHAVYSEGGEVDGETDNNNQKDKDGKESSES